MRATYRQLLTASQSEKSIKSAEKAIATYAQWARKREEAARRMNMQYEARWSTQTLQDAAAFAGFMRIVKRASGRTIENTMNRLGHYLESMNYEEHAPQRNPFHEWLQAGKTPSNSK